MLEIRETATFTAWFEALRDRRAKLRIQVRIDRMGLGNAGQTRTLKGGVVEMKIDVGPGYRVYFARRGNLLVVLLCGGDKSSQPRDIQTAMALAAKL
jgi:putative addiction module killer protein